MSGKKKISGWDIVYATRNSKLIEIFLLRAFNSIYVIMGISEHERKKKTLLRKFERNWSPLLKFYVFSWYWFHFMSF